MTKMMTMEEMLEYIKQYDGMVFKNMKIGEINKHTETYNKIWALLEKFGFKLVRLQRNVVKFRYQLENYEFIDVTISYKEVPGKTRDTITYTGRLEIDKGTLNINPRTGRPWQIGDIDYNNPLQPILTRDGWYTGD